MGRPWRPLVPTSTPWWLVPALLCALGTAVLAVSLAHAPAEGEAITLLGRPAGGPCVFKEATGWPCPQCGMTRSWIHAARLHPATAFAYSPSGTLLWMGLVGAGGVGAIRLVTRDPNRAALPPRLLAGAVLAWVALHCLQWLARLAGLNPLP